MFVFAAGVLIMFQCSVSCWDYHKSSSNLKRVPQDIPGNTLGLDLSHNKITSILAGTFIHLSDCIEINFKHNRLSSIEKDTWKGLKSLKRLDLSQNHIIKITNGAFANLHDCTHLWLGDNYITKIKGPMWKALSSIKWLDYHT